MAETEKSDGVMATVTKSDLDCNDSGNTDKETTGHQTLREKWSDRELRRKYIKTLSLGASFVALGFTFGQRGPSFLDLQIITRTDVERASFFFTSCSLGYLVGSLLAGVIYDKLNKSLLMVLSMLGLAAGTVTLPWCSPYPLMIAVSFVVGVFSSGVDTVGNAELVRIWGKEGEMAMQFLHFSFALGGVIAPLVTEPFLTPLPEEENQNSSLTVNSSWNVSVTVFVSSTENTTQTLNSTFNSTISISHLTTDVHYAYLISGGLTFLVAILFVVEFFSERYQKRRQNKEDENEKTKQPLPMGPLIFVSLVLGLFYFVYCCVDDTFASFLATFVVKQLHWTKAQGAQISSLFWASFLAGRLLSIGAVRIFSSVQLIGFCSVALVLSLLGFYLFAQHAVGAGVWVCTVAAAMSMGPIFPAGFTWMEEELIRVTGRVVAIILIASSAGNMVNPAVTGYLMQEFTPMWFCYYLFAESVVCLLVFGFLVAIARLYIGKHYVIHEAKVQETSVQSLKEDKLAAGESAGKAVSSRV